MANDQSPTIFGDDTQSRDFTCPVKVKQRRTYVRNVVEGNILAAAKNIKSGFAMNCACHEQITLNELVEQINNLLNKKIEPIYANKRPGDIKHSFADISYILAQLSYTPLISFEDGLSKTYNSHFLE